MSLPVSSASVGRWRFGAVHNAPDGYRMFTPVHQPVDLIHAAIARCRAAFDAVGPMPDEETGPQIKAWEARSDAAWRLWERLVHTSPMTLSGCAALACFVAGHDLSTNSDRNDSPQAALLDIAATLNRIVGTAS